MNGMTDYQEPLAPSRRLNLAGIWTSSILTLFVVVLAQVEGRYVSRPPDKPGVFDVLCLPQTQV